MFQTLCTNLHAKYFIKLVTFNSSNNSKSRYFYYAHFTKIEAKFFAQSHIGIKGAELEF